MKKFATTLQTVAAVLVPEGANQIQRAAALTALGKRWDPDYEVRPGFLYVRSRAISSRTNDNYDEFPAEEIAKAYKTFIGKPVFVNHVNDNHRRARGVIIDATLHRDRLADGAPDTWCEVLMEVDAKNFPKLAKAIIEGRCDRTSMGCDVEYSVCSACGNKATSPAEYCQHIPRLKGKKIFRRNAATGAQEQHLIRETCYGLRFFENSILVEQPADPTAFFLGVDSRGIGGKVAVRREDLEHRPSVIGEVYAETLREMHREAARQERPLVESLIQAFAAYMPEENRVMGHPGSGRFGPPKPKNLDGYAPHPVDGNVNAQVTLAHPGRALHYFHPGHGFGVETSDGPILDSDGSRYFGTSEAAHDAQWAHEKANGSRYQVAYIDKADDTKGTMAGEAYDRQRESWLQDRHGWRAANDKMYQADLAHARMTLPMRHPEDPRMTPEQRDFLDSNPTGPTKFSSLIQAFAAEKPTGPSVSGVVLKAADTGRVLMLQRSLEDEDDPARGTWEFPGGHHEDGDTTSLHAGIREWEEEVGQPFPTGGVVSHTWRSPNGVYQGHVVVIPSEDQVALHQGRIVPNPDDPDGDHAEQAAWWDPDHARKNPALRAEVKSAPWGALKKAASREVCSGCGQAYQSGDPEGHLHDHWTAKEAAKHHHRTHHHHRNKASHPMYSPGIGWRGGWGMQGFFGGLSGYCCPGTSCAGVDTVEGAGASAGGDSDDGGAAGDGGATASRHTASEPIDMGPIPEEFREWLRARDADTHAQREMTDHAHSRVVDLTDPTDLRAHMMEAHGYDEGDFWRNSHDEDHPALQPGSDVDRPLRPREVRSLHDWEHGHGIANDDPDYDGGLPGQFMGDSHFHTAVRKQAEVWNPKPRVEPPVQELPAHEFAKRFPPSAYAKEWKDVPHDPDFHEGGDYGWDMDDLGDSLHEHGMQNPVAIDGFGEVGDGHHRVVKALEHNIPVRYQDWSRDWEGHTASLRKKADEDQCPYDASDSLMKGGVYVCEEGHRWTPEEPAARAYHGDGPERGRIQPLASEGENPFSGLDKFLDGAAQEQGHKDFSSWTRHSRDQKSMEALLHRYEGADQHPLHPGRFGFEDDEEPGDMKGEPYYEVHDPAGSGWRIRDYGGDTLHIGHSATGDDTHDTVDIADPAHRSDHAWGEPAPARVGFGHDDLHRELHNFVHGADNPDPRFADDIDPATGRGYAYAKDYEDSEPRIKRWQTRNGFRR